MTYQQVVDEITNKKRFGKKSGVEISGALLDEIGHPESAYKLIHIAGTNGKGSTAAFLDSILEAAGFSVGRFTSPHLVSFRERIMVNGEKISEEDVVRLGEKVMALENAAEATMFDIAMLISVLYFAEKECDFWIMETGLGGKLDSTTALQDPLVCAITSIGYDHMDVLGNTLEEIAAEKAGIIVPGAVCVASAGPKEVIKIIEAKCEEADDFCIIMDPLDELPLGLKGEHQKQNAGLAMGIALVLQDMGVKILECDLEDGLKNAVWPGRMEVVREKNFLMLDGAHNIDGVKALTESLKKMYRGEQFNFVMAMMADKDIEGCVKELIPMGAHFVVSQVNYGRSASASELADKLSQAGATDVVTCNDAAGALDIAHELSKETGLKTVVVGSIYFIGEVKRILEEDETIWPMA